MKGDFLGEFEELVLLTVGVLGSDAYGVAIKDDLRERSGRKPSVGALHTALNRLEEKGYLTSRMEEATPERRGRRKRYYVLTAAATRVLRQVYERRTSMARLIPNFILE
ncbi:MAG: helix-turn-helix transcriptional regulator [Bacteroidota bacterium]